MNRKKNNIRKENQCTQNKKKRLEPKEEKSKICYNKFFKSFYFHWSTLCEYNFFLMTSRIQRHNRGIFWGDDYTSVLHYAYVVNTVK